MEGQLFPQGDPKSGVIVSARGRSTYLSAMTSTNRRSRTLPFEHLDPTCGDLAAINRFEHDLSFGAHVDSSS
jgi:hypothetical protein